MKRTLLLIALAMLGMSGGAQTVNVHRTDGTVLNILVSVVSCIDFTAPAAVELGLPSGTKWANMNVGAEQPEDYGLYFAWGESVGYGSDTNDGHVFGWAS